ncbi:MAG: ABC transporter permease [Desulfurococcaceae archaeon]|nr:ABC transporter permease [Desulfurococcaceae archaeon]
MSSVVFLRDVITFAVKALGERKLRSTLTIAGIVVGPLMMVMMGSVVSGYSSYILTQVQGLGQNVVVIFPSGTYDLSQADLDYVRSFEYVDSAEPFYSLQGLAKRCGSEIQVYVYAIKPEVIFKAMGNLRIARGEIPSESELLGAIVGYKVATADSEICLDVGDIVNLIVAEIEGGRVRRVNNVNLIVSGVLAEYGGAFILSPDQMVVVNLEAGSKLLSARKWSGIFVVLKSSEYVRNFTRAIRNSYGGNVEVISFAAIADVISSVTAAVSFINYVTSLSAFAVAVAGVSATMITSVIERTREIGVMKAVGFTSRQVVTMVLAESLVMCAVGATIGIAIGILGAHVLSGRGLTIRAGTQSLMIAARPDINARLLAETAGLTILVGLVGGFTPAYMAAKIPPAIALRYE